MTQRLAVTSGTSVPPTGGVDAIDSLYSRHVAQVKRWARRLAGPSADLEDLVHDIFLIALRKGFEHRGEATVDTWLFSITRHVVRSGQRKARIRQWLFRKNEAELVPSAPHTPQHELERQE